MIKRGQTDTTQMNFYNTRCKEAAQEHAQCVTSSRLGSRTGRSRMIAKLQENRWLFWESDQRTGKGQRELERVMEALRVLRGVGYMVEYICQNCSDYI